jgi:Domain of unknown function (DUF4365)
VWKLLLDIVGVDVTITAFGALGSRRRPRLDVQMKCTSTDVLNNDFIAYPLSIKNYEELRADNPWEPIILVVVLVPENPEEWLRQSEAELCLKRCGYWLSLRGQPATQNQTTVTVYLPRQNLFTADALINIMQRLESGETI